MNIFHLTPQDDLRKILGELTQPAVVYLKKGVYRQKIELCADDVTLIGEDRETTVISYDDYARKIHEDGREYNTFRTYTLCVTGNGVKLENLTVENANTDPREVGQCVALSVHGKNFLAKEVDLKSTQDTLFLSPFPDDLVVRYRNFLPQRQLYAEGTSLHLFENCRIFGTVDFIFGGSEAYFKNCEIVSKNDGRNLGFVAAPSHCLAQEAGFYFIGCDFAAQGALPSTNFLARPWRDFGKCAFLNCRVGNHIKPVLFDKWNDTERDKTARFLYYNLQCDFAASPVRWAQELTKERADDIIRRCERSFLSFRQ